MRKHLLHYTLSILLTSVSLLLNAQSVDIKWGKLNQPAKRGTGYSIIGERDGGIFVLKTDKKENRYIDRFNLDDLSFDASHEIELSKKRNSRKKADQLEYDKILLMKDKLIVFATKYEKKLRQLHLYARRYGLDGKSDGRWEKIAKIQGEKKRKKGSFSVEISEDKKFFVVEEALPQNKNENAESFNFMVFDSDLVQVYSKEDIKLIKKEGEELKNHKIGKDNRVYFISTHTNSNKLYSFDVNTSVNNLKEFSITFDDKDIVESAFSFDKEGKHILIAGFYTDRGKKYNYGLSGSFYIKLDIETFKPVVSNTNEFDKEFLTNFMSERRAEKGKSGIPLTFDMRNFVIKSDGGVIVLAESSYAVQHCQSSNSGGVGGLSVGVQTCYYTYHFNEVIVLNINPDGTVKYNQLIKKRALSRSYNDGLLSYSIIPTDEKLMVFYNDHYKNLAPGNKKVRHLPKYKKRVLAMATITDDGEKETESLIRHSDIQLEILPRNAVKTDNGIIIFGYYKKAIKLGRIELQ